MVNFLKFLFHDAKKKKNLKKEKKKVNEKKGQEKPKATTATKKKKEKKEEKAGRGNLQKCESDNNPKIITCKIPRIYYFSEKVGFYLWIIPRELSGGGRGNFGEFSRVVFVFFFGR